MKDEERTSRAPEGARPYEPPAILWDEELPQGPNLFSACGKVGAEGGPCNSFPAS
jgi:hypothetical protein